MTARDRFAEVKAALDAIDTSVGDGIRAIEADLRDAGVAVPFMAHRQPNSDAPAIWWSKRDGAWGFRIGTAGEAIHGAPRHVRRLFFRAVTVDLLFERATAAYRAELGEASP